jgi:hypothetical protein
MPTDTATTAPIVDYAELALTGAVNLVAILVFAVGIYFRRHLRKDLVVVFVFFNLCIMTVVSVIQMTEVAAALGFGLFAILSIIRLRSEPFSNREIGYFFGALVIGLVNGIGTPSLALTLTFNGVIILAAFVLDHPSVLQTDAHQRIVLDIVHTDPVLLRGALEQRLGGTVSSVTVHSIDFVRDAMELEVQYRPIGVGEPRRMLSTGLAWVRS